MNNTTTILQQEAVQLLKRLIAIPSFSKEEDQTAGELCVFFSKKNIPHSRVGNNVIALNKHFDEQKPVLLLNSHHDTVKPNKGYTLDPFKPIEQEGKLFGLGSNDAGGCLVSLMAAFLYFYDKENLPYNIAIAATAEEEISGTGGIEYALQHLPAISCAIVGEPTLMNLAVAERGLMVIDAVAVGKAGHAARNEGENALYKAIKDIEWIQNYRFVKDSALLGASKMTVTVIETDNKQHNVVPALCQYVIDVRINELYSFEEVIDILQKNTQSEIKPRSTRLRSTAIALDHPLIKVGIEMGKSYYGSPTTSDKALMPFPALKMGPGDSARSHTADEFIYTKEIEEGVAGYIDLLLRFFKQVG